MKLEAEEIQNLWKEGFGDCPPVSYLFKYQLTDRWFRFHSLPESKRYAENESENTELLARQNEVLLKVIGRDSECVLVSGNYAASSFIENPKRCPALSAFRFREFVCLSKQDFDPEELEPDEEPMYLNLYYANHNLKHDSLDEVLLCVANEKIVNFFVVNYEQNHIFAPYDGGVDIILKDSKERDEFRAKYTDWLSTHPSGF